MGIFFFWGKGGGARAVCFGLSPFHERPNHAVARSKHRSPAELYDHRKCIMEVICLRQP